jgi:hypothetical protein
MLLVGARGFEPPTSRSQTERTTRLCYAPKVMAHSKERWRRGQVESRSLDRVAGLTGFAGCQKLFGVDESKGAVADLVFDGVGEFGEGLGVAIGDEEWVVAEAARTPW